jgi:glutaconyl-CoA/methylmalonyl-CoA decarboxylase subunit gamma
MKLRVKLENKTYEVEVEDIKARPILAKVDGETFEVWPEEVQAAAAASPSAPAPSAPAAPAVAAAAAAPVQGGAKTVPAPIPGVILSLSVREGETVKNGQELLILEAMKMNNAIRASRDGTIARIHVAPGDHVKHGQPLMEFSD